MNAARVTWAEVRQNELYFCSHENGGHFNPFLGAMGWWQARRAMGSTEPRHRSIIALERLLAAELALRCYLAEQGHQPARLEQLVPQYLQRVPLDPFSGKPVIYRPQGTHWLLYSVGPDGVDDGGSPVGHSVWGSVTRGDIFYDSPP